MGSYRYRSGCSLFACLMACSAPVDAPLLQVEAVSPDRVEPGQTLRVQGAGFPVGREGEVVLTGLARRPGASPREVSYRLAARAISAEHLEATVPPALLEATGGRATFTGTVRVVFPAAHGGTVSGRLGALQLDVAPAAVTHLDHALLSRREAIEVGRTLGLEFDERGASAGVRVASVTPGGTAEAAGLREDDRLVAMDGVRVAALEDCLPPPGVSTTALTIQRPGTVAPVHLRLPIETERLGPTPSIILAAGLFGLVLLLFLVVGPGARVASWLGRPALGVGAVRWLLGGAGRNDKPGWRALSLASTALSVTLVFVGIAHAGRTLAGGLGIAVLLLSALTLRLVSGLGQGAMKVRARAAMLARFGRDGLPTAAAVGAAAILAGTGRADGLVLAQGFGPGDWFAFSHPAAFAALPAFVAVTLGAGGESSSTALAQLAGRAHLMVVSGLGALLFLGGWAAPVGLPEPELVGVAAFVLKAWLLLWLGVRVRTSQPVAPRWGAPLALAALLGALAWLATGAAPEVVSLGRPMLLAAAALVLFGALLHRLRSGSYAEPQVHALL